MTLVLIGPTDRPYELGNVRFCASFEEAEVLMAKDGMLKEGPYPVDISWLYHGPYVVCTSRWCPVKPSMNLAKLCHYSLIDTFGGSGG